MKCSDCQRVVKNQWTHDQGASSLRPPRVWMIPGWVSDGKDSRRDQFIHSINKEEETAFLNIGSRSRKGDAYGRKFLNEVSEGDIVLLQNTEGYINGRGRKIPSGLCGIFTVSGEKIRGFVEQEGFYEERFDRYFNKKWEHEYMIPLKMYPGTSVRIEKPVRWSTIPCAPARTPAEKKISVSDIEEIASKCK
jgi:hypothetical protein